MSAIIVPSQIREQANRRADRHAVLYAHDDMKRRIRGGDRTPIASRERRSCRADYRPIRGASGGYAVEIAINYHQLTDYDGSSR
jgi:hypothetical protein